MSFLNKVASATATRQSEYFSPGSYLVRVDAFKEGKNRKGRDFVVLETTVLDSDNEDSPCGSRRSWLLMQDMDTTPRNVRAMLCAVLNISDDALTLEMIQNALEPDEETGKSAIAGLKVFANARTIETKRGTEFTLLTWNAVDQDATNIEDAIGLV